MSYVGSYSADVYGKIVVIVSRSPQGKLVYEGDWRGPDKVMISKQLMEDHLDPPFHRDGDDITLCQYHLKILGRDIHGDYVAERVKD